MSQQHAQTPEQLSAGNVHEGFQVKDLFQMINDMVVEAKTKLAKMKENGEKINIGDMLEMQMLMNKLSQSSEMATSVVSATHQAISGMTRGIKGQ